MNAKQARRARVEASLRALVGEGGWTMDSQERGGYLFFTYQPPGAILGVTVDFLPTPMEDITPTEEIADGR